MKPEFEALQRAFQQSQIAESFAKLTFVNIEENIEIKLVDSFIGSLNRYVACPQATEKTKNIKDLSKRISLLSEVFPSMLFTFSDVFPKDKEHTKKHLKLLSGAVDFIIINSLSNDDAFTLFSKSISREDNLETLNEKANDTSNRTYLPGLLKRDLDQLATLLNEFPDSEGRAERIELLYIFRGLSNIFYRIYFGFISTCPWDAGAEHVNGLFFKLFGALRKFEIRFFLKNKIPLSKVEFLIEKDDPKYRHPLLRKHVFALMGNYNPVISDGRQGNLNVTGQKGLRAQLVALTSMSPRRLEILLITIKKYRGLAYFANLLNSLQRAGNNKVTELKSHLQKSESEDAYELLEEIQSHFQRLSGKVVKALPQKGPTSLVSLESIRKREAKRKMEANKNRNMMTQHEVEAYLNARMKKLMDRVVAKGALTKDKIPEYLARFATASSGIMHNKKPTKVEIEDFQESTNDIIDEIIEKADIEESLVADDRAAIQEKTEELKEAVTIEEKSEIMNDIGIKISEVQEKADEEADFSAILAQKIIPIGLEENAPLIPVGDFFAFPLVEKGKKPEDIENWFAMHFKYLKLVMEKGKLPEEKINELVASSGRIEKHNYKKHFDIFPGDHYEDTVMMAIFSLWENKALEMLRISE
ncbi:MAG: hypothetical protein QNL04_02360 [SAR324 cluster bacterium]|nr:hypothetical protein [SAR324 cluster bacterium]